MLREDKVYLVLFLVFLGLSLLLIVIGLFRPEHTEFSLVGFAFLFILSFVFVTGDVQYQVGVNETNTYGLVNGTYEVTSVQSVDVYETFQSGGLLSHFVGYWLAVMSLAGFVIVIVSAKPGLFRRREE